MDIRLKEIASKAAGTYFIVTDNSGVVTSEATSNLRLFFINVNKGPVNTVVIFQQGDATGFQSIFGKGNRQNEKRGNFSNKSCLEALTAGPIAVINLRKFDDSVDEAGIVGLNPNVTVLEKTETGYSKLFNVNGLWSPKAKNIVDLLTAEHLLNIGNVGTSDVTFFVVLSTHATELTNEGALSLRNSTLTIDDYPGVDFDMLLKDTFVDVYIFNNTFNPATVGTNQFYGQLFDSAGNIEFGDLETLSAISESGFNRRITGSLIPNLKNEFDENISIDVLMNSVFPETGLISYINDDLLELVNVNGIPTINTKLEDYYTVSGGLKGAALSLKMLSHVLTPQAVNPTKVVNLAEVMDADILSRNADFMLTVEGGIFQAGADNLYGNKVLAVHENGIRIGDELIFTDLTDSKVKSVQVVSIEILDAAVETYLDGIANGALTYSLALLTLSGKVNSLSYSRKKSLLDATELKVTPFALSSYKARDAQFTNGTAARQKEILDVMLSPGIVKGLKNFDGVRYLVDAFKSYVEASYKSQFGQLVLELDKGNKFVRSILNEPFIEDLEKSTNPLFKQSPTSIFDLSFLPLGGNKNFSTVFLTKFTAGAEMCFFFGPGKLDGNNLMVQAAGVSNAFISKAFPFDVVANSSGYIDNVGGIEFNPDDTERGNFEKFRWNPIVKNSAGFTIFGNLTGQKDRTALQQIHNSELLAYIKESLFNLSRDEAFKKGLYNEYLATEIEVSSFFENLVLMGAIAPNPVVICNASNNTADISKQKIKLIHIEYTNIDSLDKVVFDLNLN